MGRRALGGDWCSEHCVDADNRPVYIGVRGAYTLDWTMIVLGLIMVTVNATSVIAHRPHF